MRNIIVIVREDQKEWRAEEKMEINEDFYESLKRRPQVLIDSIDDMQDLLTKKITETWTNR